MTIRIDEDKASIEVTDRKGTVTVAERDESVVINVGGISGGGGDGGDM